jgi:hypothetical protein
VGKLEAAGLRGAAAATISFCLEQDDGWEQPAGRWRTLVDEMQTMGVDEYIQQHQTGSSAYARICGRARADCWEMAHKQELIEEVA